MHACHRCGSKLRDDIEIYRSSTCPACGSDLKVCLNCAFYAPGSHWDCRETICEPVREKDRANFCDSFRLAQREVRGPAASSRGGFDKLFGNG